MKKVLLSRRWPEAVEVKFQEEFEVKLNEGDQPLSPAEFRAALMDYDAICPTVTDKLGAEVFDGVQAPRCKILGNYGVGFAHIDVAAAKAAGIAVTNTPDVLSECTADIAMTLLLMAARRAGEGEREVRAGAWTGWRPTHMIGTKVSGKRLGIVGFGRIGQEMARRAHHGFGMQILVQNRSAVAREVLAQTDAVQVDSLADLLPQVDFLSMHCPGGEANRDLIDANALAVMKRSAILVNTARGEVVNDEALIEALQSEKIAAAGLDVFDGEPDLNAGYLACDNAVLLPHLGSATDETRAAMGFRVLENLLQYFDGQEPRDRVV